MTLHRILQSVQEGLGCFLQSFPGDLQKLAETWPNNRSMTMPNEERKHKHDDREEKRRGRGKR